MADPEACPRCGGELRSEKTSLSGDVVVTWLCFACGWSWDDNRGLSLGSAMNLLNQPEIRPETSGSSD